MDCCSTGNRKEINNENQDYVPEKKTWVVIVAILLILMLTISFLFF